MPEHDGESLAVHRVETNGVQKKSETADHGWHAPPRWRAAKDLPYPCGKAVKKENFKKRNRMRLESWTRQLGVSTGKDTAPSFMLSGIETRNCYTIASN